MTHELKTWPDFYEATMTRTKRFEVRQADRDFAEGDLLVLREYDPDVLDGEGMYTGRVQLAQVQYILDDDAVPGFMMQGFVIMDIEVSRESVCEDYDDDWLAQYPDPPEGASE